LGENEQEWEIPTEAIEQLGLELLLPLLPLTKGGHNYATLERMIRGPVGAGTRDLIWIGEALAGMIFIQRVSVFFFFLSMACQT
jgi:hypothetical protein